MLTCVPYGFRWFENCLLTREDDVLQGDGCSGVQQDVISLQCGLDSCTTLPDASFHDTT